MANDTDCRRRFLYESGAALAVGLAGCSSRIRNTSDDAAKLVPRYDPDDEHQLIRVAVSEETVVASTIPEPESSPTVRGRRTSSSGRAKRGVRRQNSPFPRTHRKTSSGIQ